MAKADMSAMLKRRMAATQRASELRDSDAAYEKIFQRPLPAAPARVYELPINKLRPFFTADIGFKPYPPAKLEAFAEQIAAEGILERILVRPIPNQDGYEILAGHNRTNAGRLAGLTTVPAEVIDADNDRAITIAVSTNLLRRQDLSVVERGKAYKALLEAKNRSGKRNVFEQEKSFGDFRQSFDDQTEAESFGENRQRYNARKIVAEFFGVTEYEVRKAVKLTQLIPELLDILENTPKQLSLTCADLMADYDAQSQSAFVEMCTIEGYRLNKATMQHITHNCPPPSAERQDLFAAWREARSAEDQRRMAPPKKIAFDRKKFAPYLDKLGSDAELEALFLEFLQERTG